MIEIIIAFVVFFIALAIIGWYGVKNRDEIIF